MKSQRGNVIVYALVGLVLFGVLVGSVWWVKNRNQPAKVATDTSSQQKTDTEVKQDESPASSAAETQAPEGDNTQEQTQTGSSNTGQPQRGTDTAAPVAPESQTPRTGPSAVAASGPLENMLISSLVLGTATFAGTSYARSRR